jgi:hypothetical protein
VYNGLPDASVNTMPTDIDLARTVAVDDPDAA